MAINPIKILKDVIDSVTLTVTIDSVSSLGGGSYKVFTKETYYLRTLKKVTISSVDYQITGFSINEFITVKALSGDIPVTASSFTIDQPLFVWGNPQMVSAELVKRVQNKTAIWPYIWVVEISNEDFNLDPSSAVKSTPSFNMFFLDSSDKQNWTISEHYDNAIYTLNNYLDTFVQILKSRRDLFDTDSINFNKVNHVNFGDYIVDEGMRELILNDEVTGIQVKIDVPLTIGTCKDTVITPNCTAGTVTINGTSLTFGSVPSGGTLDIDVKNTVGASVGSEIGGEWIVPTGGGSLPVHYVRPALLDLTSDADYDEGWHFDNGTFDYTIPADTKPQELEPSDPDKLIYDSVWAHKFRFVGSLGGYYDASDGNYYDVNGVLSDRDTEFLLSGSYYIIDEYTGLGWRGTRGGQANWATQVAQGAISYSGFTDFYLPTRNMLGSLIRVDVNNQLYLTDRPPFDIQLTQWTCTPFFSAPTTTAWWFSVDGQLPFRNKTNLLTRSFVRAHYT